MTKRVTVDLKAEQAELAAIKGMLGGAIDAVAMRHALRIAGDVLAFGNPVRTDPGEALAVMRERLASLEASLPGNALPEATQAQIDYLRARIERAE